MKNGGLCDFGRLAAKKTKNQTRNPQAASREKDRKPCSPEALGRGQRRVSKSEAEPVM